MGRRSKRGWDGIANLLKITNTHKKALAIIIALTVIFYTTGPSFAAGMAKLPV